MVTIGRDPGDVPQDPPSLPRVELVMARRNRVATLALAVVLVLGCGGVVVAGADDGARSPWWVAGAVAVLGALGWFVASSVVDLVRPARLVVDADGITEVGAFRVRQCETWEDCVRFSRAGAGVGFQNRAYRHAPDDRSRRRLRGRFGYPTTLPAGYGGLDQDELLSLLNRYRETFTDRRRRQIRPTV
jgi:hypothetical protein